VALTRGDIMTVMRSRASLCALITIASLAACGSPIPRPGPQPGGAPPSGTAQPSPAIPSQPAPAAPERSTTPPAPPPRQFHLGAASSALVSQAHTQASGGDYGQAAATLERALRIEPDNPLVWIELGRVHLAENDAVQADAMGHKALALATGDPAAQSSAWHLIADSLRASGRNGEAAQAEQRAAGLAPH
jgi:Tfp pilus assembly protein PilF